MVTLEQQQERAARRAAKLAAKHEAIRAAGAARPLSVTEANDLAGDRARVSVDLEDPRLWRVRRPGSVQVHEPMTREAWLAFLGAGEAAQGAVDVSAVGEQAVPAMSKPVSQMVKSAALEETMREHFSPAAVAAIAAILTTPRRVRNQAVQRELDWFAGHLVDMLGKDEFKGLCVEAGL